MGSKEEHRTSYIGVGTRRGWDGGEGGLGGTRNTRPFEGKQELDDRNLINKRFKKKKTHRKDSAMGCSSAEIKI